MTTTPNGPRRRVAVLGGGAGSMGALWALTSLPGAAERFDITVYQMGWRLGGKGASGRNAALGNRIEEHGLHVWAGFYRNAFRMMREIYAAQPSDGRLFKEWSDAFKRHSSVILEERVDGEWVPWPVTLAEDPIDHPESDPTTGGEIPAPGEYLRLILDALIEHAEQTGLDLSTPTPGHAAVHVGGWLSRVEQKFGRLVGHPVAGILHKLHVLTEEGIGDATNHAAIPLLKAARALAAALPADPASHDQVHLRLIGQLVHDAVAAAEVGARPAAADATPTRAAWASCSRSEARRWSASSRTACSRGGSKPSTTWTGRCGWAGTAPRLTRSRRRRCAASTTTCSATSRGAPTGPPSRPARP